MNSWSFGLNHELDIIMVPIQVVLVFCTFYYLFLFAFGIYRRPEKVLAEPQKKFALVVSAHNEEAVIGQLVENLKHLDYPKYMYDIMIIADNCTDKTASIAKEYGAMVFERFHREKRGKGFALEWMFEKIFQMEKKYDAVVIFDADNLVKTNFLREMNHKLVQGHQIVQCYLDSKNPFDTWVTASFSIAFWHTNRLLQLARYNIGLSNILGGTGMCITTKVLKEFGWGATSLTEDLEFSMKALLNGVKTTWAHDAVIYDEKPLTFMQAWNQRKRWAQGHVDIFIRYFPKLMWKGVTTGNFSMIDASIHLFQPALVMMVTFFLLLNSIPAISSNYTYIFESIMPLEFWQTISYVQLFSPVAALLLDRVDKRAFRYILYYPIFIYSWIPICFIGFIYRHRREWSHTAHTRSISYQEVMQRIR